MTTYYIASNRSAGSRKLHYDEDCSAFQSISSESVREASEHHVETLQVCSICKNGVTTNNHGSELHARLNNMDVSEFDELLQEGSP